MGQLSIEVLVRFDGFKVSRKREENEKRVAGCGDEEQLVAD